MHQYELSPSLFLLKNEVFATTFRVNTTYTRNKGHRPYLTERALVLFYSNLLRTCIVCRRISTSEEEIECTLLLAKS